MFEDIFSILPTILLMIVLIGIPLGVLILTIISFVMFIKAPKESDIKKKRMILFIVSASILLIMLIIIVSLIILFTLAIANM